MENVLIRNWYIHPDPVNQFRFTSTSHRWEVTGQNIMSHMVPLKSNHQFFRPAATFPTKFIQGIFGHPANRHTNGQTDKRAKSPMVELMWERSCKKQRMKAQMSVDDRINTVWTMSEEKVTAVTRLNLSPLRVHSAFSPQPVHRADR